MEGVIGGVMLGGVVLVRFTHPSPDINSDPSLQLQVGFPFTIIHIVPPVQSGRHTGAVVVGVFVVGVVVGVGGVGLGVLGGIVTGRRQGV